MPDYQKAKIYKIVDPNEEMIYVGSTCQSLSQRMAGHRSDYKKLNNYCSSHDIFDKYGVENCKILLIENYSCNSKEELIKKEGEYIRQLNCVNKVIPGRTEKEWHEDNKDKIKENYKQYYQDNKDKITENHKQYYQDNKDKITEYSKQYRDDNRDEIKECSKQYYEKNRDKITEYKKEYYEKNKDKNKDKKKEYNKQYYKKQKLK
tara:strand:+ start:296 stop:910 length:615 start_codon:yes stop_codon:yes gene_type:complete